MRHCKTFLKVGLGPNHQFKDCQYFQLYTNEHSIIPATSSFTANDFTAVPTDKEKENQLKNNYLLHVHFSSESFLRFIQVGKSITHRLHKRFRCLWKIPYVGLVLQGKLPVPCKIDKLTEHVQYSSGPYDGCGHVVRTIIQLSVHMKSPLASDVTFCNNSSDFIPDWYLIWNWIQLSEDLQIKKHTDKNTINTEHWRAV